jgi:hypothetical protein
VPRHKWRVNTQLLCISVVTAIAGVALFSEASLAFKVTLDDGRKIETRNYTPLELATRAAEIEGKNGVSEEDLKVAHIK